MVMMDIERRNSGATVAQRNDIISNNINIMAQVAQFYYLSHIEKHTCYTHATSMYLYILKGGKVTPLVPPISYLIDIFVNIVNLLCHFLEKLCHSCATNLFGVSENRAFLTGHLKIGGNLENLKRTTEL